MVIQRNYEINPEVGFVGDLARPDEPHALESGLLHVPDAATRMPRPGDALYYNETENRYAIPTTAAQVLATIGILHYRRDAVVATGATVEFGDGAEIEVAVFGTFWVSAGSAMEYGQRIDWDIADFQWDPSGAITVAAVTDVAANSAVAINTAKDAIIASAQDAIDALGRLPIACVSRHPVAANGIAQARIGYGRIL